MTVAASPTASAVLAVPSTSAGMPVLRSDDADPAGVDIGGGAGARVEGGIPFNTGPATGRVGAVVVTGPESGGVGNAA
jgi:hypothetical protein